MMVKLSAVKVTGRDPKFGYRREFCRVVDRNWSRSGKHGETRVLVEQPGLYEVSSPETGQYGREARAYCEVT